MRKTKLEKFIAIVLSVLLSGVITTSVAFADVLIIDGDGVVPVAVDGAPLSSSATTYNDTYNLGNVIAGTTVTHNVILALYRNQNASNVFKSGTAVPVVITGDDGDAYLTPTMDTDSGITTPSNWSATANGTLTSDTAKSILTITVPASAVAGNHTAVITYNATGIANNNDNNTVTRTSTLTITYAVVAIVKTTPTITWDNPADIDYGTALSATQLNATASVPGAFEYVPAAGTVLNPGIRTLRVNFTPSDSDYYNATFKEVTINVNKATPVITWSNPADIDYGTSLSGTQLSASSPVSGVFTYNPLAGVVLGVGSRTLHVDFTPSNPSLYNTASKEVTINVNKVTPTISWSNPADIDYGTLLSGTQLNATASVPGTFEYTPASGTKLNAGDDQALKVTFTPNDLDSYNTESKEVRINVKKIAIKVTADPQMKIYGEADPTLTYKTEGTIVPGDSFTGTLSRDSGEDVDSYAIKKGSLTLGDNYTITFVGDSLAITVKDITVTADAQAKIYGKDDPVLTYKTTSGSLVGTDKFTGSLTRAAGSNVGEYAITQGDLTAGSNYNLTFIGAKLTIIAKGILVTADAKSKIYGETDPALTYTVETGGMVGTDTFTGSLTRAAGTSVGDYAITQGSLTAGDNYTITFVEANLTIIAKGIIVTADAKSKTYGEADPVLTYTVEAGGIVGSDSISGSLARDAGTDVGDYEITIGSLTAGNNYKITLNGAKLTIIAKDINVTAESKSKTYGDADPALTYKSDPLVGTDAFSGSLTRDEGSNVGDYAITQGDLTAGDNYKITFIGANFRITAKGITVTADEITKTYGDTDPALIYKADDLVGTDAFSGSLTRAAGTDVGDYAITQGTLTAGSNYEITFIGANFSIIAKIIKVTADAKEKIYGESDPALTYIADALVGTDKFSGDLTRAAGSNVGDYAITQGTLTAGTNYSISYTGANLTIKPKAIKVTADPQTKVYGEVDPVLTFTKDADLVTGDSFSGTLSRDSGTDVGKYDIVQGTLALSANYTLTFVGAKLEITPKPITATADSQTKVYGEADPALTYKTDVTLVTGDSFTGALSRDAGENKGLYNINQGTLALNGNYTLSYLGAKLEITPKPITATADSKTKVYGEADPALTFATDVPLVTGDSFTGALSRDAGENKGSFNINQGTLALNGNYTLTYVGAKLEITPKPITATADSKTKVYGEADPALTFATDVPLVTGDSFTGALSRDAGENKGLYAITIGDLALSTNYTLTFEGAKLEITPKPITATADSQTKMYGDSDPALTYTTDVSLITGDSFTGALSRDSGENKGLYAITIGTLALSTNYTLSYVGAKLEITQKAIKVTADPQTKVYGAPDPTLTFTTDVPLVSGDSFTGLLSRDPGKDIGLYEINQGTLALNANYILSYVGAQLEITPKAIKVTADSKTKIYGDADPALTYKTDVDLVTGDGFTGTLSRDPGNNIGLYDINQGTLGLSTNYTLTYAGAQLKITAKEITVTADPQTKYLNAADPVLTYKMAAGSLVTGDSMSGNLTRVAGETVGPYAITQGTLSAGSNYSIKFIGANLTIIYKWVGILQPINSDNSSVFKIGSTIPVKFQLKDANNNYVTSAIANLGYAKISNGVTGDVVEAISTSAASVGSAFRYDTTGNQYIFNLNTKGWSSGTYLLTIRLNDGTSYSVKISSK